MKVLVIGGNRFFGRRLVKHLIDKNYDVTLLNRGNLNDGFGERVKRTKLDRKTLNRNHHSLKDVQWDIVYDQVAYDATDAKSACETFEGRTRKYIFTSSQSVYGPGVEIQESAFQPNFYKFETLVDRSKEYGEAKRQAEAVFFQHADFPVTAVRFPIVMGEDDYTERLKFHVDHVRHQKAIYFPNIDARISFVHAEDAAHFLASLAEKDWQGPINCCAKDPLRLRDLIALIEETLKIKAHLASSATSGDHSPYGIEKDWYMSSENLKLLNFAPKPIPAWLPDLVKVVAKT